MAPLARIALCLLPVLLIAPAAAEGGHDKSLHSYVTAAHKTAFDGFSLLVYGTLNLARSAVHGAVGVTRSASLEEFDFARELDCNASRPALTVIGTLVARMGTINNGHVLAGRGSRISHSVRRGCSQLVGRYDSYKRGAFPYEETGISLIKDSGHNCAFPVSGSVEISNSTMVFKPSKATYSCYSVFDVHADDLRLVRDWHFAGTDPSRNLIINISGRRAVMKDFKMVGFNAERTMINFCSTYGRFQFFNARIHGSILAPTTYFTMMDTIVNGSMITSSLRGQIVVMRRPYYPC